MTVTTSTPLAASARMHLERCKSGLLAHGVRIGAAVRGALGGDDALTVHEYSTTGGITLELPGDVVVNAPFDSPEAAESPYVLVATAHGGLAIEGPSTEQTEVVRVVPLPGYLERIDHAGDAVADTTMSHVDRVRVSPIVGCAYDCQFCNYAGLRYEARPIERLLRGIDIARADSALPPRHLLISGGSPAVRNAAGLAYFEDVCTRIVEHVAQQPNPDGSPFEVDVMLSARPDGAELVRRLVDRGVTGFSINLEAFSDHGAQRHLPRKHRLARPHLESMIEAAVDTLGRDGARVRSLLIPGLESVDETLTGVQWLAERGCAPVLSPLRIDPVTPLAADPPTPLGGDALLELLRTSRTIVAAHGVHLSPRCVACQHNVLAMPWDAPGEAEA